MKINSKKGGRMKRREELLFLCSWKRLPNAVKMETRVSCALCRRGNGLCLPAAYLCFPLVFVLLNILQYILDASKGSRSSFYWTNYDIMMYPSFKKWKWIWIVSLKTFPFLSNISETAARAVWSSSMNYCTLAPEICCVLKGKRCIFKLWKPSYGWLFI